MHSDSRLNPRARARATYMEAPDQLGKFDLRKALFGWIGRQRYPGCEIVHLPLAQARPSRQP